MQKLFMTLITTATLFNLGLSTHQAHATRSRVSKRTVFVQGRLVDLQDDIAVLEQKRAEGKMVRFKVPKSTLPSWDGFVVGKADLVVPVPFNELIQLNSLKVAVQDDPESRMPSSKKPAKRVKAKAKAKSK